MTLKEKFFDLLTNPKGMTRLDVVDKNLEITDDFAIGFNDWVNVNAYKFPTKITTKELLETYKKEKGL